MSHFTARARGGLCDSNAKILRIGSTAKNKIPPVSAAIMCSRKIKVRGRTDDPR